MKSIINSDSISEKMPVDIDLLNEKIVEGQLRHKSTRIETGSPDFQCLSGTTTWEIDLGEKKCGGLFWEWCELCEGVIALADPNSIETNLEIVNANGAALQYREYIVWVNGVVNRLSWQQKVAAAVRRGRVKNASDHDGEQRSRGTLAVATAPC